jgi:N-methylhydantoinase B
VADLAGSDAQVPRSINVCLAYTTAYTSYGIKAVLCPDVPNNDGALAPLDITAPVGSILNSRPPAAGGARALIGHFLPPMVVSALAGLVPDRVIAGVGSPLWCMNMAGTRADGSTFANMFFLNGGYGASAHADGSNVLSWPSNVSSTPVEVIEQLAPLRVHFRRLRSLGDANGAFRGGTGQEMLLENLNPTPAAVSFLAERTKPETAAPGIRGGLPGAPGEVVIDGKPADPKARHIVEAGTKILLKTPGGGGYGDRRARSRERIEQDRVAGHLP